MMSLERKGIRKNKIVSRREFVKANALASIDPKNYWKRNDKKDILMKQMMMMLAQ